MSEKVNEKLFTEFAPNTMQEWIDKVTVDLKGADFNKKLVWKTNEGFSVQPMYRLENMEEVKNLDCLPGEFPYVRGNKKDNNWLIRQDIVVQDVAEANKKALDILNRGVDSIGFVIKNGEAFNPVKMDALLKDIYLDCVEVNFMCEMGKTNVLNLFFKNAKSRGFDLKKISGGINIDPMTAYILRGKALRPAPFHNMKRHIEETQESPNYKVVEVGGWVFNNSGSSVVQELGFSLAAAAEYLDKLTDEGLKIDQIAPKIRFHFATGSKYFMEIAKLRAGRYLWAKIVKAYAPKSDDVCKMYVHAETSEWNKTLYDAHVNMLRTQTEAMSAVLGGVDSLTIHPFDDIFEKPTDLAERVARNQQILLKEESHFGKIADIAGGSYYIEELTEKIIEAAWELFLKIQEEGGYFESLCKGTVQKAINETAAARKQAIALRKENYVGTNQFPNFNEKETEAVDSSILQPIDMTVQDSEMETLKLFRGTQEFEFLRLKTDVYAKEHGRPVVYMFPMGNLAMRKARAQFACNFFACAGFEVKDNNGFATVDEGVAACLANKASIVVLCSADDEYAGFVSEAYEKLKNEAIVVVAGNPECRPELENAGVTNYIHVKNNVLEELKNYQSKLGI